MPRGIVPERAVQTPRAKPAAAPGVYILFRVSRFCGVLVGATRSDRAPRLRPTWNCDETNVLQLCESCVTVIMRTHANKRSL